MQVWDRTLSKPSHLALADSRGGCVTLLSYYTIIISVNFKYIIGTTKSIINIKWEQLESGSLASLSEYSCMICICGAISCMMVMGFAVSIRRSERNLCSAQILLIVG